MTPLDNFEFVESREYDSGGAGAFGTTADYLQFLVPLINEGKGANGAQTTPSSPSWCNPTRRDLALGDSENERSLSFQTTYRQKKPIKITQIGVQKTLTPRGSKMFS
jgi:hypothetical protein